ncbi:Polysaccharide biosynthesis protein [Quadrisphaera granulorum]|uniref:Polysaccharide biosynthesis protein n=1 Tax=Quadrisphaera granulorum TaxID=317664 RepID=A0A315ZLP3_9ACTN|nr:polysaccharide biosynthesis protein [Quadrisphaera granulorum]SZE99113.1 Polysaccharide biosynthesis protein [Quadrisphaera granulorum]
MALYVVVPSAGLLAPLMILPVASSRFGAAGWASVAVGQSLGIAACALAELGWGVLGPQRVARAGPKYRSLLYRRALASKLLAAAACCTVVSVTAPLLVANNPLSASLAAVGSTLAALSSAWFFIGMNRPLWIVWADSIPKFGFSACIAGLLWLGLPLWSWGFLTIVQVLVSVVIALKLVGWDNAPRVGNWREAPALLRAQGVLIVGRGTSSLYTALPVSIVSAISPQSTAIYAALDRLTRMLLSLLAVAPTRMQQWVGHPRELAIRLKRSRQAFWLNAGLGAMAGVILALLSRWALSHIFSGVVEVTDLQCWLAGAVVSTICASRGAGLGLIARGLENRTTHAILPSALIGVVGVSVGSLYGGVSGAMLGVLSAELLGLAIQLYFLSGVRIFRRFSGRTGVQS